MKAIKKSSLPQSGLFFLTLFFLMRIDGIREEEKKNSE